MINKNLRFILVGLAFVGMAFTMPSCPGDQAMQQQVDTLQTTNADLNRKVHTLTGQAGTLNNDMSQVKDLLSRMTNVIQAQKAALEEMDRRIKEVESKIKKGKK